MMRASELTTYLKQQFPLLKFYTGSINKLEPCVGVYSRGTSETHLAIGGVASTSFAMLPVSILVHWTENSDDCEQTAQSIYDKLFGLSDFLIGTRRIVSVKLLDPCPVNIGRDDSNIAEMTVRATIYYEREVM